VSWGETFFRADWGENFHTRGRKYSILSARIFSPGGENILAEGREYSLPPETF